MPPRRIRDIHVHFPRNFRNPDEEPEAALEHMAMRLGETDVVKAGHFCPAAPREKAPEFDPKQELSHERCIEMAAKYAVEMFRRKSPFGRSSNLVPAR